MHEYDFCFAWSWPYDVEFACLLESACRSKQISLLQVTPENIEAILNALACNELGFRAFFDRASDTDQKFQPLAEWAYRQDLIYINRFWLARRTWDKALMHHQLTRSGIDAPYTVILPSYQENPVLPTMDLSPLGGSFAVKPAHGGGGAGVVVGSLTWEQILQIRQQNPNDQYLIQGNVIPIQYLGRPAWFRVIYCLGNIYSCWWDPTTHLYTPISEQEQNEYGLSALADITRRIAQLSYLELFSTEIAYTAGNRFLAVDYVNDPIDLRLQSKAQQGVPDFIINTIAQDLVAYVVAQFGKGAINDRKD